MRQLDEQSHLFMMHICVRIGALRVLWGITEICLNLEPLVYSNNGKHEQFPSCQDILFVCVHPLVSAVTTKGAMYRYQVFLKTDLVFFFPNGLHSANEVC